MSATTLPATVTFDDLHALRIKGRASDEALGHMLAVSPGDAAIRRATLLSEGLAQYREGRMPGSSLTPDGRALHSALLTERLTDTVKRSAVEQGLAGFLPVNGALKRVCSSWQTREDGSQNGHDDAAYDASVIEQLTAVNADATALLRSAARIEPRFGRYADRLDSALARIKAGDAAAFLRPMTESYHDIWMELHEDLILLAGRVRGEADEG
jgi:hypothetical protein